MENPSSRSLNDRLKQIAALFFKLGVIGFGGPNAHIAMMEDEVVKKRQWLSRDQFLDLLGATNLIPGPNSTELAIHIGYVYAGFFGLVVAGVAFIVPAILITTGFAWLYVAFGTVPQFAFLLYGIKPAVLAIVVDALWRLGKKAIKTRKLFVIAIAVALLVLLGQVNEILALLIGGVLGMLWLQLPDRGKQTKEEANILIASIVTGSALKATAATVAAIEVSLWKLGWSFLKIGSILFGGGYVLLSFLQGEFVEGHRWLTQQQLLDAIAIGQFTPGPILSTAAFIGFVIAGVPGAIVATIGIFLPSFMFVFALNPLIPRLRQSKWTSAFLDAVNASAIALMAAVTVQLAIATLGKSTVPYVDLLAIAIALISAVLALRFRVGAAWLVVGGALIGWIALTLGYVTRLGV
ncbi:chromate efflux transporter [Leptolyngbya sp. NIES-2104]|uniref:chromate efflux transporter n=1 Tax=Leptolyngbya sp. NIES-2104 TaxID=1552121 RepID=UPI0006EC708F|nr:chromate efflux transporter [Leptolyngbya sp. NIES-2104]GAP94720.1 chromate transport protein ChrA [Leptolyngbya sp. NIES-2104]